MNVAGRPLSVPDEAQDLSAAGRGEGFEDGATGINLVFTKMIVKGESSRIGRQAPGPRIPP